MATTIQTKILLPRGTVESLASRAFTAGELVQISSDSGFRSIFITKAGTGLSGTGAAEFKELALSAAQVVLSSGATVQAALDAVDVSKLNDLSTYAQVKVQLSSDGYALVGEASDLSTGATVNAAKKYAEGYVNNALTAKNKVQIATSFSGALAQTDLSVIKVTDADLTGYVAALQAGTLEPNAVYVLDLSATNALGQKVENVADGVADSDAATYGQLTAAVDGLATADSLTAYAQTANLGISYDSTSKKILFAGGNSTSAEIDASDFIKDGMLSAADYDSTSKNIILSFNTDSGTTPISVDVGDLVDTYTAESNASTIQLAVSNNEFSASVVDGSITPAMLSATAEWVFDCN